MFYTAWQFFIVKKLFEDSTRNFLIIPANHANFKAGLRTFICKFDNRSKVCKELVYLTQNTLTLTLTDMDINLLSTFNNDKKKHFIKSMATALLEFELYFICLSKIRLDAIRI